MCGLHLLANIVTLAQVEQSAGLCDLSCRRARDRRPLLESGKSAGFAADRLLVEGRMGELEVEIPAEVTMGLLCVAIEMA